MISYGWKMRLLWLFNHVVALYSAFTAPQWILPTVLFAVLATSIGSFAGWHRYWSHRSFKTDTARKTIMTWLGLLGCTGKPVTVMAGHRLHHKHSDTEQDIHSPKYITWWENLLGFYKEFPFNKRMMKDLVSDPQIKFIQRHYFKIIISLYVVLFVINPVLPGFIIGFTALYTFWIGTFGINYITHVSGDREHETDDNSRNNFLVAIVAMGEGWHNNHHNNSLSYTTQNKWYQIDPTGLLIKYFLATDLKHDSLY